MKLLKSTLLLILLISVSLCNAQNKKPKKDAEQKSVEMTAKLSKEVKLTKAQSNEIKAIYLDYLKKKEFLEDKIDALKKERNSKIDLLLTDDQKKKKASLKKKKKK